MAQREKRRSVERKNVKSDRGAEQNLERRGEDVSAQIDEEGVEQSREKARPCLLRIS